MTVEWTGLNGAPIEYLNRTFDIKTLHCKSLDIFLVFVLNLALALALSIRLIIDDSIANDNDVETLRVILQASIKHIDLVIMDFVMMVLLLKVLHDRGKGAFDCSESLCERSDDMVSTVWCEDIDVAINFPWRCMRREVPLDTLWPARYATALAIQC